jgi:hypothetical protein
MGHGEYSNANQASGETFENYGLPVPELFPMYKLVLQTSTGYTGNASKVIISSVTVINTAKAHSFLSF